MCRGIATFPVLVFLAAAPAPIKPAGAWRRDGKRCGSRSILPPAYTSHSRSLSIVNYSANRLIRG